MSDHESGLGRDTGRQALGQIGGVIGQPTVRKTERDQFGAGRKICHGGAHLVPAELSQLRRRMGGRIRV